jgi:membrane protein implicated in regulation of membrane protease activity
MTAARRRPMTPLVVGAGSVGWVTFVAMTVVGRPYGAIGLAALIVFLACWLAGRVLTRDLAERRADQVDEYEFDQRVEVRGAGYVLGLGAMIAVFVLLAVAVQLAEREQPWLLLQAPQFVFASFLLAAAAPTYLLAWRTRNRTDEADDTDEGELR